MGSHYLETGSIADVTMIINCQMHFLGCKK
jgi:hypothetical protein